MRRERRVHFPGHTAGAHHFGTMYSLILKRLTFIGAVYLAIVCLLPEWMIAGIHHESLAVDGWRRLV